MQINNHFGFSVIPKDFQNTYNSAQPFPHIVIDKAFDPAALRSITSEFPSIDDPAWRRHVHAFSLKLALNAPEKMGEVTQDFLKMLNSEPFIKWLEQLTGIEGLMPDPYLEGGGLHQITAGGFLGVHADFNFHEKLQLHRRINLLIYLNEDWEDHYGSNLELWDGEMTAMQKSIAPIFNRMVVFNTTDQSFHGHPDPLKCPGNRTRKSIALYYYSATRPADEISKSHSTLYRLRPGENKDMFGKLSFFGRAKRKLKKLFGNRD